LLRASRPEALETAISQIKTAKDLSSEQQDHALHSGLAAFEAYISVATPLGQLDDNVVNIALNALEQLAVLPQSYSEARDSVAIALGKAIQKKLAARSRSRPPRTLRASSRTTRCIPASPPSRPISASRRRWASSTTMWSTSHSTHSNSSPSCRKATRRRATASPLLSARPSRRSWLPD